MLNGAQMHAWNRQLKGVHNAYQCLVTCEWAVGVGQAFKPALLHAPVM